jgi:hypothetical protein
MKMYHVTWAIEVDADNVTEAAMQARMTLLDPHCEALNFKVFNYDEYAAKGVSKAKSKNIDLSNIDFCKHLWRHE